MTGIRQVPLSTGMQHRCEGHTSRERRRWRAGRCVRAARHVPGMLKTGTLPKKSENFWASNVALVTMSLKSRLWEERPAGQGG